MTTNKPKYAATTQLDHDAIIAKCLSDKCRVCLDAGEIPIFGLNNMSSVVQEFGGINVLEKDKRPQLLCAKCNSLLEGAILFRHRAQKSEQILVKVCEYLFDENELKPPYKEEQSSKLAGINCNKNELSNNMHSKPTVCSDISVTLEQHSNESEMSFQSESDSSGNNKCEYLEFNIFSTDDEFSLDSIANDSNVKHNRENRGYNKLDNKKVCENSSSSVTCDVCQKVVGKGSYERHMKLHRQIYKQKVGKKPSQRMECHICHKLFSSTYYKFHMKLHGSEIEQAERYRKCHLCDKSLTASYYNSHMMRVHDKAYINNKDSYKNDSRLKCPICDKKVYEDQYKEHLARHGQPPKKYVCEKCGMTTIYPSAFKTHCLTHSSQFEYKCKVCPYQGLHLALLRIHERTHTGEYKYKCQFCSATFITKSNLSQHLRVHGLPVQYTCKECDRGFHTRRALDRHYSTIHLKDKSNICDICGKGFGHRDNMLSHQLQVHDRKRIVTKGRLPSYLRPEHTTVK